jgi:hypothetical protein
VQTTGTIFNKQTQLLAYAVRDAYLALKAEATKIGMKINEKKTKYTIAG